MNSRFFIGLLLGVAITSVVVVLVNYHSMFSTQNIEKQSNQIKQEVEAADSSDGVMMLVPNVKMKVARNSSDAHAVTANSTKARIVNKVEVRANSGPANTMSSDALEQVVDKINNASAAELTKAASSSSAQPTAQPTAQSTATLSIARYNNLEDADAMVGTLSLLGFNPIIQQHQKDYEVVLIAANSQEKKMLIQELKKNNLNFKEI